jgi:hypothetical protein
MISINITVTVRLGPVQPEAISDSLDIRHVGPKPTPTEGQGGQSSRQPQLHLHLRK